tara:strand:- start:35 stop:313 length:279 start_codon:yes stop_codon:yes gene_type:complete
MARTNDELTRDYAAMGDVIELINCVINSTKVGGDGPFKDNLKYPDYRTDDEKREAVARNVAHLEQMVAKDDWGSEDMTASNAAISAGNTYVG